MWTAKVMLFSSNYQSILAQFSRRKLPDNGLYTEYIKKFRPMPVQFSFGKWNTGILQIFYLHFVLVKKSVIFAHDLTNTLC